MGIQDRMRCEVMSFDMPHVDCLLHFGPAVNIPHIVRCVVVLPDTFFVRLEVNDVDFIKTDLQKKME